MTRETNSPTAKAAPPPAPTYPIRCTECGRKLVFPATVARVVEKSHDGRLYALEIPDLHVLQCRGCGEVLFDSESDAQISAALRKKLGLLSPEQIRASVEQLGMTGKEFAGRLGVAAETVSRWMTGALIQSRAMDNLMRLYFTLPEVRRMLADGSGNPPGLNTSEPEPAPSAPDPVRV